MCEHEHFSEVGGVQDCHQRLTGIKGKEPLVYMGILHLTHLLWFARTPAGTPTWPRALITPTWSHSHESSGPGLSAPQSLTFTVFIRERNCSGSLFLCNGIVSEIRKHVKPKSENKADYMLKGITKRPQIFLAGPCSCCSNGGLIGNF